MNKPALTTAALTLLRVVVGFVFTAHGLQKFGEFTITGTQTAFGQMGVPAAQLVAPAVATLEVVGGVALIVGFCARVFAVLFALEMFSALILVHARAGFFADNGGVEFVLTLTAASLAIALAGAGRLSVDAVLFGRTRSKLSILA